MSPSVCQEIGVCQKCQDFGNVRFWQHCRFSLFLQSSGMNTDFQREKKRQVANSPECSSKGDCGRGFGVHEAVPADNEQAIGKRKVGVIMT